MNNKTYVNLILRGEIDDKITTKFSEIIKNINDKANVKINAGINDQDIQNVKNKIGGISGSFKGIGKDLTNGLLNGLNQFMKAYIQEITKVYDEIDAKSKKSVEQHKDNFMKRVFQSSLGGNEELKNLKYTKMLLNPIQISTLIKEGFAENENEIFEFLNNVGRVFGNNKIDEKTLSLLFRNNKALFESGYIDNKDLGGLKTFQSLFKIYGVDKLKNFEDYDKLIGNFGKYLFDLTKITGDNSGKVQKEFIKSLEKDFGRIQSTMGLERYLDLYKLSLQKYNTEKPISTSFLQISELPNILQNKENKQKFDVLIDQLNNAGGFKYKTNELLNGDKNTVLKNILTVLKDAQEYLKKNGKNSMVVENYLREFLKSNNITIDTNIDAGQLIELFNTKTTENNLSRKFNSNESLYTKNLTSEAGLISLKKQALENYGAYYNQNLQYRNLEIETKQIEQQIGKLLMSSKSSKYAKDLLNSGYSQDFFGDVQLIPNVEKSYLGSNLFGKAFGKSIHANTTSGTQILKKLNSDEKFKDDFVKYLNVLDKGLGDELENKGMFKDEKAIEMIFNGIRARGLKIYGEKGKKGYDEYYNKILFGEQKEKTESTRLFNLESIQKVKENDLRNYQQYQQNSDVLNKNNNELNSLNNSINQLSENIKENTTEIKRTNFKNNKYIKEQKDVNGFLFKGLNN